MYHCENKFQCIMYLIEVTRNDEKNTREREKGILSVELFLENDTDSSGDWRREELCFEIGARFNTQF